jgi:hypothetical protein
MNSNDRGLDLQLPVGPRPKVRKRHSQHLAPNQIPERVPRGFPSHLPLPYENSRPMLPSSVTLCVGRTNQYEENV